MRRINVGGGQGRGNPPAFREPDEGPGLAVSRWVYALGAVCGVIWGLAYWAVSVYWPH